MQIWLDQVQEEPFNWDETQSVAPERLDRPELLALGPVSWRGQVIFTDPGYFLRAKLSYEQTLSCNRCLKPIVDSAGADVELMIMTDEGPGGGGEHELRERDLGTFYMDGKVLDTDPILVEQLQLNIPMKPLCREDCKGICPTCGADLNLGACVCEEKTVDPRWASLAALKSRLGADQS
ncbi:MAG TPA: DUF177 domain-containing protein [Thermoanaerobaculia bacterium]|nr:DUF177 domain-containing protein [Thermoanaerobaculia bacterium]